MKILVCISVVPETTAKININANGDFDKTGVQFIMNPCDEAALSKALLIKEENPQTSITIINVGQKENDPILRKGFSVGASQMIRIDAEAIDSYNTALELKNAVEKKEGFDLILCGKESIDYLGGAVGGMLAALLNYDYIADVINFTIDNQKVTAERTSNDGKSKLEACFPLVLSVSREIVEDSQIKIPNMRGIMQARTAPLEVIASCNAQTRTNMHSLESVKKNEKIKMIDKDNLQEIVDVILANKK